MGVGERKNADGRAEGAKEKGGGEKLHAKVDQ